MKPTSPQSHAPAPTPLAPRRSIRWRGLIIILALGATLLVVASMLLGDRGERTVATVYAVPALVMILTTIWGLVFSGARWLTRLAGLGAAAALACGAGALVRLDGFEGDMFPRLAWRSSPTREEVLEAFRDNGATPAPEVAARAAALALPDWPGFRGRGRDGVETDVRLSRDFAARPPRELWRHPVGLGWSSFVIAGDLCFTQEQIGAREAVVCYDVTSGAKLWEHLDEARFSEALGGDGPRSTPTLEGDRLYALGAAGNLDCLDAASGAPIWSANILADAGADNITWGMSASPLIAGDLVVVNPGGRNGKGVIAYERATGTIRWARGDEPASYAGLRLENILGKPQLILFDGAGLAGLRPDDGTEVWRYPWTNDPRVNAAQPIAPSVGPDGAPSEDLIFISSGYNVGSALLRIRADGERHSVEPVWRKDNFFKLKFNDAVLSNGVVYGLDEGLPSAIEIGTGKRLWKARADAGYGQLILLGDILVILSERGDLIFAEANSERWVEIHRTPALSAKTWNHPAYARGRLLVRNDREAVCYELALEYAAAPETR